MANIGQELWLKDYEKSLEKINRLFQNKLVMDCASARLENAGDDFFPNQFSKRVSDIIDGMESLISNDAWLITKNDWENRDKWDNQE